MKNGIWRTEAMVIQTVFLTFGYFRAVSSRCGIEKKEKEREHKPEGTRGCTRPEVFGEDSMKKDDRNHPNSMQHQTNDLSLRRIQEPSFLHQKIQNAVSRIKKM